MSQIQTTDTGLKYIIHEQGSGAKPTAGQTVTLLTITALLLMVKCLIAHSSRGEPIQFPIGTGQGNSRLGSRNPAVK